MAQISRLDIETQLARYQDPHLKQDLMASGAVKNIVIQPDQIMIDIVLAYPAEGFKARLTSDIKQLLSVFNKEIITNISWKIEPHVGQPGMKGVNHIKNIIPVASGKGGVGKSTLAVNLALALAQEGARVGILDADIYGPSQPMMLGALNPPEIKEFKEQKILLPIIRHGIQSMSIGYLIDQTSAMIWRGPMVTTALQQLFRDTQWDELDYLIVDLPPGTGDIQLTLAQKIPVSAAVVVSTPQDLALLDARRACEMFRKVNIPVLGLVENMSLHTCSQCGHVEPIFGEGGGERLAAEYDIELLGRLPLDIKIREQADTGIPFVVAYPESESALQYRHIARTVAAKLSLQPRDYSSKFPNIVVKNE
jgi:ATP-binding protein involved in chromosome partitioning